MGTFGENLRALRTERGLSQEALAQLLGTSKQVISRYENGQRSPKISAATKYAQLLGVSIAHLNGEAESSLPHPDLLPVHRRSIPLFGEAVNPREQIVEIPSTEDIPSDFALYIQDESMQPRFLPGDLVFFRSQADAADGQVAAIRMDQSILLRRIYHLPDGLQLIADNPGCPPMILKNGAQATIIGIAVRFTRSIS